MITGASSLETASPSTFSLQEKDSLAVFICFLMDNLIVGGCEPEAKTEINH